MLVLVTKSEYTNTFALILALYFQLFELLNRSFSLKHGNFLTKSTCTFKKSDKKNWRIIKIQVIVILLYFFKKSFKLRNRCYSKAGNFV